MVWKDIEIPFERVRSEPVDILFKNDDYIFSYRVGGILIRDGRDSR